MDRLRGTVALVTGASRGIGPHIARALATEGAGVALCARDQAALEAVARQMRGDGARVVALAVDLLRGEERTALVRRVEEELGPIDLLVNDAGTESEGAFASQALATISQTIELNLAASMHLARLVLTGMLARGRGHLVNIASLGGKKGAPYAAVYCATKAGLIEWTGALRWELAGTGVSASVVCPGYVTGEGMFARFGVPPPARLGSCTPDEVADAVVRAIRKDLPEVIVNSLPVRPFLALGALSPRLGEWIFERIGIPEFQRAKIAALPAAGPARALVPDARIDESGRGEAAVAPKP